MRSINLLLSFSLAISACTGLPTKKQAQQTTALTAPSLAPNVQTAQDPAVSGKYADALEAMRDGDNPKARRLLEELSQTQPTLAGPRINLGILLLAEKDISGAEAQFRRVLEHHPRHPIASNQLGLLLRQRGRFNEAEKAYVDALQSRPEYQLAHRNIGILYDLYLRKPDKALYHYQRYQALMDTPESEVTTWIADLKLRAEVGK